METIRCRKSLALDLNGWKDRLSKYDRIVLDLGTGDGRYARTLANRHPRWFVIGASPLGIRVRTSEPGTPEPNSEPNPDPNLEPCTLNPEPTPTAQACDDTPRP